jgi:hypothetical protein
MPAANAPLFWQVGLVVANLEESMDELSRVLGAEWGTIVERVAAGTALRFVFSKQGPPYIELIEGPPGSQWDSSLGSRLDHIGYSVDDLSAEREALERNGARIVVDGQAHGHRFNYHLVPKTNLRIESVEDGNDDETRRARLGLD